MKEHLPMLQTKTANAAIVLSIMVLSVVILVYGRPFLIPLTFAGLLAMALLPAVKWMQRKGINRAVSTLISMLLLVLLGGLIIFLIGWQVQDLASDASSIEKQVASKWQQLQQFVAAKLGISPQEQQQVLKKQQSSSSGKLSGAVAGVLSGLAGLLTNTVLVLVYIFLLIYFRDKLKGFVLKIVPADERKNASVIISDVQKVAQKYLSGLGMMIVMLWIMYSIGFSIAGVKHAIFFAVLCGMLEVVPFIGNLAGTALTLLMSLAQGGDTNLVVGILITYALVQFIQTYLIEPLVVGAGVSINPLFTIAAIVAGELVWGIAGMILAIPLIGIVKIICDHVESLKPYAFLIGTEPKEESPAKQKIKEGWRRIKTFVSGN